MKRAVIRARPGMGEVDRLALPRANRPGIGRAPVHRRRMGGGIVVGPRDTRPDLDRERLRGERIVLDRDRGRAASHSRARPRTERATPVVRQCQRDHRNHDRGGGWTDEGPDPQPGIRTGELTRSTRGHDTNASAPSDRRSREPQRAPPIFDDKRAIRWIGGLGEGRSPPLTGQ